jgi:hypothetical protein
MQGERRKGLVPTAHPVHWEGRIATTRRTVHRGLDQVRVTVEDNAIPPTGRQRLITGTVPTARRPTTAIEDIRHHGRTARHHEVIPRRVRTPRLAVMEAVAVVDRTAVEAEASMVGEVVVGSTVVEAEEATAVEAAAITN